MNPHRLDLDHKHGKQLEQEIRKTLPSLYKLRQTANVALPDSNESIFYREIDAFIIKLEGHTHARFTAVGAITGRITTPMSNVAELCNVCLNHIKPGYIACDHCGAGLQNFMKGGPHG